MIERRILAEAKYLLATKKTISEVADHFQISKITIHKDLQEKLIYIDYNLYQQTRKVLQEHLNERHIRGGEATKKKYQSLKESD